MLQAPVSALPTPEPCGLCDPAGFWRGRFGRFARLLAERKGQTLSSPLRCGRIAVPHLFLHSPRRILAPPQTARGSARPRPACCVLRRSRPHAHGSELSSHFAGLQSGPLGLTRGSPRTTAQLPSVAPSGKYCRATHLGRALVRQADPRSAADASLGRELGSGLRRPARAWLRRKQVCCRALRPARRGLGETPRGAITAGRNPRSTRAAKPAASVRIRALVERSVGP